MKFKQLDIDLFPELEINLKSSVVASIPTGAVAQIMLKI